MPKRSSDVTRIEGGVIRRHDRSGVASRSLKDVDRKIAAFKQATRGNSSPQKR